MAQIQSFTRYQWATDYHQSIDPNVFGQVAEDLESKGRLTAHDLVEVSRPEDAPLHSAFEWNDETAAEKYREEQARCMIRQIRIVREDKEPTRVFVHLERGVPEYSSIAKVILDQDQTSMMLRNALRELDAFRKKYNQLRELASVFEAIDQLNLSA